MAVWLRARIFVGVGALLAAGIAVVAACGGSSSIHAVPDAGDADGAVPEAGPLPQDAGPAVCPPAIPVDDTACDAPGLWCEYGGVAHSRCTTRAICFKKSGTGGEIRWTTFPPDYSCAPNDDACPLEFAPRAACPAVPGVCDYAQGRCTCAECGIDGGRTSQWLCRAWSDVGAFTDDGGAANVPGACPAERPRLGTACVDQGFVCGYDACYGVPLGPYLACTNGTWAVGPQTDLCNPPACN